MKIKQLVFFFLVCILFFSCNYEKCFYYIPMNDWIMTINNNKNDNSSKKMVLSTLKKEKLFETVLPISNNDRMYSFAKNKSMVGFFLHFSETPYYRYVVIKKERPYMLQISLTDTWISSSIIKNGYVIYSTEFTDKTIKKIEIQTGRIFEYDGWYPNVEIYPVDDENIFGVFMYEGKRYLILNDTIVESEKTIKMIKDQLINYRVK